MKVHFLRALVPMLGLAAVQAVHANPNLIQNGNFGTDDFTDWQTNFPGSDAYVEPMGAGGMSVNPPPGASYEAYVGPGEGGTDYWWQNIATTAGDTYQYTFYFSHTTYDGDAPAQLNAYFGSDTVFTVNGTGQTNPNLPDFDPYSGTWLEESFDVVGNGLTDSVGFSDFSNPGYWGVTDVSVVDLGKVNGGVPDQTSTLVLAALSCALVTAAARRKAVRA